MEDARTCDDPSQLLLDPTRLTVTIAQAAAVLGIAKSTAHNAYRQTGFLCAGVPVMKIGRRHVVPVAYLRAALGVADPSTPGTPQ